MKKVTPVVSFCIATYRRPEFLETTLQNILSQVKNHSIEIIVSDNDTQKSGAIVCSQLYKKNTALLTKTGSILKYVVNRTGEGMVSNFNNAFKHSTGKYVCFMADDDPPSQELVPTLLDIARRYPNNGCYYGACWVNVQSDEIALKLGLIKGNNNFSSPDREYGAVVEYDPVAFLTAFLKNDIFPYMLWSVGFVDRKLVQRFSDPMPDYGTAFLTDVAFMLRSGAQKGCVVINKPLGTQTIHDQNFGRTEVRELKKGVASVYSYALTHFRHLLDVHDVSKVTPLLSRYFLKWSMNHLLSVSKLQKNLLTHKIPNEKLIQIFNKIAVKVSNKDNFYGKYLIWQLRLRLALPIIFDLLFLVMSGAVTKYLKRKYRFREFRIERLNETST